jgi:hypothetical protein
MAIEAELADGRILEFPDGTDPSVVQATVKKVLASGRPAPETTAFGQVKEGFKGLIPGAVGLAESAAVGASALLPEDMEKSAREKIKSVAAAAKEPFAAAAGYEDTVGRKLGEAVGSTIPFLAAGPLGLAGRAAAVGLGVGAGAGEARTRAEADSATGEQRGTATALGMIPGALEAFAPLRILSRIPTASKAAGVEAVKRAMVAGGEEAAQEAASGFAQNLIAKGVYKPEQELIEGLGEQAAYGGATGAIVQGLLDLALGRRARGAQTPQEPPAAQPGPQLAPEAPAGTQGALLAPDERAAPTEPDRDLFGKPVPAPKAPEEPVATAVPEGQQDLGLDFQREYPDLVQERERLKQQPQTPEVKARVQELTDQMALYTQSDIESLRAEKETQAATAAEDAATRKKFPALAEAPDLLTQPDEVKARTQGELFPSEDLAGPTLREKEKPTAEKPSEPGEPTPVPPYARTGDYQYKLPLRGGEVAQPLTMQNVLDTGIPLATTRKWFEQNVVGKTQSEVQALVGKDPTLLDGPGKRAKVLRELLAPQPAKFEETPRVQPTPAPTPAVEPRAEPRASEPSLGVPSEPAPAEPVQPGAGVPATAGAPVTPDGRGLVSAGRPAVQGDETAVGEPVAVTPPVAAPVAPAPTRAAKPKAPAKPVAAPAVEPETADAEAARKAEADDFKRRLEALEKVSPAAPKAAPAPAAPAPAAPKTKTPAAERAQPEPVAEKRKSPFDISGPSIFTREEEAKGSRTVKGTRYSTQKAARGQAIDSLKQEIASAKGRPAEALRRMIASGKVKLEESHPDGNKGGMFDGETVTLYAQGIPEGQALPVALHEVGAHMGMEKLLGTKQYNAVINKLLDWIELSDGSVQSKLAQAAYRRIPIRDIKNEDSTVARDEMVAYFVEELASAEAKGQIPKLGPLRTLWNQIKTAITTSVNKALGTSFGINDLTPQQIGAIAEAAMVQESKTALPDTPAEAKQLFSVAPGTEALIDSMGPLEAQEKPMLRKVIDGFKDQTEVGYAVKFRTQTADSAATIEHRLREQFDGAVKDKLGKFNPMGLYRQAQDYSKMLLEYMQVGAISKEPATGLWKVKADSKVRPPVEVYSLIDKWAAKNGYSRERGTQIASRILEGVRLDAMRTANKNDGTSFLLHLKDNEIDQLVREYKADPDLQAMSKAMDEARLAMVDNMVKVGRLSAEQGQVWKDAAGYVPFDRIEDFATSFTKIKKVSNKGLAQVGKLPELVGSINRPVGNVFDNYLNTLGWMVGQTIKTDGTVQTLRSLEDAGHAKYLGRSPQGKDNTVGMYVKGEMMYWELPSKYDVLAFKDLNPPKAKWLQILGGASNILRKAVTVLPPFALKQVTDDVQRAIMTSGVKNPGALLRMTLSNFGGLALAELRGIQHPTVKQFGALGLTGEYDFQQGKPATSVLKDLGFKPRGKFETLIHRLDGITRASDLAVRKAIYDQSMKETNDELLSQTRAREFINFRRRGASDFVGAMVTTIPFFNAYIQGMDVLYRAASGKDSSSSVGRSQARRMFWSRAAIAMTLSSLYALGKGDDDEDYNEMDLRVRDGNWILPGGFKLPVPGELGALFKVIPERVVEYMRRQGTPEEQEAWEATRTALAYIFEQYVGRTVPVPQGVKPLLEAWTNYSFFTGRELEGIYQKQQDPSLRRASNTSELAIAIANFSKEVVGVDKLSPIMIDNALNGYFGSTAGLLVAVTDSLLNPTRVDRPLHKYALVSNYLYDPVGTRRMTEFYEDREKVGRANATLNELMKTDLDKAAEYAEKNADKLMLESAVNSTLEQLERTRAYKKYLNSALAAEDMTSDERSDQIKEIRQMEAELTGWLREAKASLR